MVKNDDNAQLVYLSEWVKEHPNWMDKKKENKGMMSGLMQKFGKKKRRIR